MDLDEGVQAGGGGLVQQGAQGRRVEGGDDQQDRVGPPGARLPTWYAVVRKSLRSTGRSTADRTASRSSGLPAKWRGSVSTLTAEALRGVGGGQGGRVEVDADVPLEGTGA